MVVKMLTEKSQKLFDQIKKDYPLPDGYLWYWRSGPIQAGYVGGQGASYGQQLEVGIYETVTRKELRKPIVVGVFYDPGYEDSTLPNVKWQIEQAGEKGISRDLESLQNDVKAFLESEKQNLPQQAVSSVGRREKHKRI